MMNAPGTAFFLWFEVSAVIKTRGPGGEGMETMMGMMMGMMGMMMSMVGTNGEPIPGPGGQPQLTAQPTSVPASTAVPPPPLQTASAPAYPPHQYSPSPCVSKALTCGST